MNHLIKFKTFLLLAILTLTACTNSGTSDRPDNQSKKNDEIKNSGLILLDDNGKLGDIFKSGGDEIGSVNKYIWQASIEVLKFLPIDSADPFSGIIVFGKGQVPGSSQIYDATVYISDPALDARSLNVTVRSENGTISSAAKREIESAILSRARQLRLKELEL